MWLRVYFRVKIRDVNKYFRSLYDKLQDANSMTQSLVPHDPHAIRISQPLATALDVLLYSLSDSSKRQYEYTFKK